MIHAVSGRTTRAMGWGCQGRGRGIDQVQLIVTNWRTREKKVTRLDCEERGLIFSCVVLMSEEYLKAWMCE
jgi:hypothetical protein